jgi:hypothetical protein
LKKTFTKLLFIPLTFALLTPSFAQEGLAETLAELARNNAKGYLGPVVTAFGTGANSGTFHRAKPHKILGFDLTLNATIIGIPEEAQEFEFLIPDNEISFDIPITGYGTQTVTVPFNSIYESGTMVPTFFGESDGVSIPVNTADTRSAIVSSLASSTGLSVSDVNTYAGTDIDNAIGTIEPLGGNDGIAGIGIPMWPSIMPQFSVGLPMNVELTFRGFSTETTEGDEFSFKGFGAKVGFSEFIPLFPLALSAGYYATNLNLAEIVKGSNSILTLQASKSIPIITVYGGIGLESTDLEISYDYENPVDGSMDNISFNMEGDNKTRIIAGLRFKLALLSVHFDINAGEYTAYNAGIGLTLR